MIYTTPKELLSEIKHIMDLNDISRKELASKLNMSQQNVSKILSGTDPRYSSILKICNALDLEMDIIFKQK